MMSDKDDPVIKALRMADNALSGMTEDEVSEGRIGQAVMANKAIQKAIAVQKQQAWLLSRLKELILRDPNGTMPQYMFDEMAKLDEVKK